MSAPHLAVSRMIDAPPDRVYALIADYNAGHPRILPKPYFKELVVEQGGVGAGTCHHRYDLASPAGAARLAAGQAHSALRAAYLS